MPELSEWLTDYCRKQEALTRALPIDQIPAVVDLMRAARDKGGRIFVFGNGGSAANASHFATDVGKGASHPFAQRQHPLDDRVGERLFV